MGGSGDRYRLSDGNALGRSQEQSALALGTAGFQILDVAIYFAFMVDGRVDAWATFTAITVWSYFILIAVTVGILTTPRPNVVPIAVARPTAG